MSQIDICPICRRSVQSGMAVCPSCGFKMLGKTQEFKPISIQPEKPAAGKSSDSVASLKVVRGPQTGVVYRLEDDSVSIGRSPNCDVFLNDMTVSRIHAHLQKEGGCFVISDDNSYNGVWVNNRDVKTKALESGDCIQIGTFCLLYEEKCR